MDDTQHTLNGIDEPDAEKLLDMLEAAQQNMPPTEMLAAALVNALRRKNHLITVLAEPLMGSDCDCDGCVRLRAVVAYELDVAVCNIPGVDPDTLEKCERTRQ